MRGIFLFCGIVAGAFASANLINAGFESAVQGSGGYNSDGIQGWTNSSGATGVWNIPLGGFFAAEAPEGTQIGYSNATSVAQQSSAILGLGPTTLSIMGGRRTDSFAGSFRLELWAGGTVSAGNVNGGGMRLAFTDYVHTDYAPSSFTMISLTYNASAGDSHLGDQLSVRMVKTANGQMNWDDVRLTAVPEPNSLAAFAVVAGLAALRRRRR